MKILSFLIVINISIQLSAHEIISLKDTIKYELYLAFTCPPKIEKTKDYELFTNGGSFCPDSTGRCFLPNEGLYWRAFNSDEVVISDWNISLKRQIQSDTIIIPPIYLTKMTLRNGLNTNTYVQCGKICNGHHISYRENGQIWQDGEFKNGQIIEIETLYPNGKTEILIKHNMFSNKFLIYDNKGVLRVKEWNFLFYSILSCYNENKEKYSCKRFLARKMRKYLTY